MKTSQTLLYRVLGWNIQGDLGPWTFYTSQRKGLVWFLKAPPKTPPTVSQVHQRNKFRIAAVCWNKLTPQQREDWRIACLQANLAISGYNFFVFYLTNGTDAHVQTIERQSHRTLLPLWTT